MAAPQQACKTSSCMQCPTQDATEHCNTAKTMQQPAGDAPPSIPYEYNVLGGMLKADKHPSAFVDCATIGLRSYHIVGLVFDAALHLSHMFSS